MGTYPAAWMREVHSTRHGHGGTPPKRVLEVTQKAIEGLHESGPDQLAPGMHAALFSVVLRNLTMAALSKGKGRIIFYTDLKGVDRAYSDLHYPMIGRWATKYPFVGLVDETLRHLPGQYARRWTDICPLRALNGRDLATLVERETDTPVLVVASSPLAVPEDLPDRRHVVLTSPYPHDKKSRRRLRTPLVHQHASPCSLPGGGVWADAQNAELNSTRPSMEPVNVSSEDRNLSAVDVDVHNLASHWVEHPGFVGLVFRINQRLQTNCAPFKYDERDIERPEVGLRGLIASARGLLRTGRMPPSPSSPAFVTRASEVYSESEHLVPPKGAWLAESSGRLRGNTVLFGSRRAAKALIRWTAKASPDGKYSATKAATDTVLDGPVILPGSPTRKGLAHLLYQGGRETTVLLYPWEARRYNEAAEALLRSARFLGVEDWPKLPSAAEPAFPREPEASLSSTPDFERFLRSELPSHGPTHHDDEGPTETIRVRTTVDVYVFRPKRTVLVFRNDDVWELHADELRPGDVLVRILKTAEADANSIFEEVCRQDGRMSDTLDLATSWRVLLDEHLSERYEGHTIAHIYDTVRPGVDEVQFRAWLHGDVVAPLRTNLRRVAEILDLPPSWADSVYAGARAHYKDRRSIRRHLYHLARNESHKLYGSTLEDDGDSLETLLKAASFETVEEVTFHD